MKDDAVPGWLINIIAVLGVTQFPIVVGGVVALACNLWHPSAEERFWFGPYCGLVFFINLCIVIGITSDRSEEMKSLGGKLDNIAEELRTIQFQLNEINKQKP
jgi:hypothetical protein